MKGMEHNGTSGRDVSWGPQKGIQTEGHMDNICIPLETGLDKLNEIHEMGAGFGPGKSNK